MDECFVDNATPVASVVVSCFGVDYDMSWGATPWVVTIMDGDFMDVGSHELWNFPDAVCVKFGVVECISTFELCIDLELNHFAVIRK